MCVFRKIEVVGCKRGPLVAGKRMIHDKICESRKVNSVSFYAEALWVRIITKADDNGNYWRDPFRVHANCMFEKGKATVDETAAAMKELAKSGLILIYRADGREYVHIADFHDYQELRGDRNAQVEHPLHPTEMGGAYTGEGLRRDAWRSKVEREEKPTGNHVVTADLLKQKPTGTPEVEVEFKVSSNSKSDDESVPDPEPEEQDSGDWPEFVRFFRSKAGGTKDFARFPQNQESYHAKCRQYGSAEVDSVVETWVELNGGKGRTKKNKFACKNFLADVDGLIEDKKEETTEPEEISRIPQGAQGVREELMR